MQNSDITLLSLANRKSCCCGTKTILCAAAGHDYYHPHSFRKTLVRLGEQLCRTPEEFKAWSQNLGHEKPLTTFLSYGYVDVHRQGEVILWLWKSETKEEKLDRLINLLEQKQ